MLNNDSTSAGNSSNINEQKLMVSGGTVQLEAILSIPADARALIVFAYYRIGGSENTFSNLSILAAMCQSAGLSTLLVNLLTPEDEELDKTTQFFRENISVLHQRVIGIANWLIANVNTQNMGLGYIGAGVCASAILAASAVRPDAVNAIVAVAPSTELVNSYLPRIVAPTLIIAPERDVQALTMYHTSISAIASDTSLDIVTQARQRGLANTLEIIPGVQNAFENNQSLHKVGEYTTGWFTHFL
jgi:putative phosphoribosyl transferase